jgi:hypothetical protein
LHDALEFARSGDTLIVWKLDRLARSMKQLIETVETISDPKFRHSGRGAAAQIMDREVHRSRHLGQDLLPCVAKSSRRPIGQDREKKPAAPR